ncbi:MAG: 2-oxoglutarate ferredoxin oxidoreductase subunit alpha [Flavobacteriales bacterium]|mgnify:CR=1 FL=1|nr:2-oxoglutarate ferredoxin oxidoreductase subunit alpha [Flavobacteriales bacterium]|tara:strand:- start:10606 stop:12456 length:1851 start_codon:yes stop_codon:yes gene_type:complete
MSQITSEIKDEVTILFAGDSGDGIQLTGGQFTDTAALVGNDISTFPNFPAEIRAPQGTVAGVSGFQLHFGSIELFTPGDQADVLVVMNAAALKSNLASLKKGGIVIANIDGFDKKNLRLAKYEEGLTPLTDGTLDGYKVHEVDVTKITRETLKESGLGTKIVDRSKNMFVLGFLYWMYNRSLDNTIKFIETKFAKKPELINSNISVLKAGYHYGDTAEAIASRFEVKPANIKPGTYRNIMGNEATAIGLISASQKTGLELFCGTYPITPASDILHFLSKYKNFGVKTFQAEDEIAGICSAIGASFGGKLGITTSSGPGIALKGEAIGLAGMFELPLVVINVQRGGPSTGLPTKTEQADLFQAMYGRNGESPVPVIAAQSPKDCFDAAYEACRIAIEHMTPVFLLTDGYIANGSEPWEVMKSEDLKNISVNFAEPREPQDPAFLPYKRDDKLVRPWAIPGTKGLAHRIGGLEKDFETGNVSYDPENHEKMVKVRQAKVDEIANYIPKQKIDTGAESGDVLLLSWGSTYGAVKTATTKLIDEGFSVSHAHVRYLNPLPKNLGELIKKFDQVVMPEMNNGQFIKIIREKFLVDAKGLNKIKGLPFATGEIVDKVKEVLA